MIHAKFEGNRNIGFDLPKKSVILQADAPKDAMLCMTTIEDSTSRINGFSNLSEGTQFFSAGPTTYTTLQQRDARTLPVLAEPIASSNGRLRSD